MTEELEKTYRDEDGNLQFGDQFLEEIDKEQQLAAAYPIETSTWEKFLEKLVENTQANGQQSLKNIAEKFEIEKFTSKNSNAGQWIDIFERECTRFNEKKKKYSDCSWINPV